MLKTFQGAPSALIEAIGPACLTFEEQESCVIDPEPIGWLFSLLCTFMNVVCSFG